MATTKKEKEVSQKNTDASKKKVEKKTSTETKTAKRNTTSTTEKNKTTTKTTTSSRNTKTTQAIKKQSRRNDDRIKQIIYEQLANINEIEKSIPTTKKKTARRESKGELPKRGTERKVIQQVNEKDDSKEQHQDFKHQKIEKKNQPLQGKKKYDPKAVEEKIVEKKKLPNNEIQKIRKKVFTNLVIACSIAIYFICLNVGYTFMEQHQFEITLKILSIVIVLLAILIFEIAYRRDSGIGAIYGIEILILAMMTLSLTYLNVVYTDKFVRFVSGMSVAFIVYYCFKNIILWISDKVKYKNSISDVREIMEE